MREDSWQTWAEQVTTGLALVDTQLRVIWMNPALAECLTLGPRSALGQTLACVLGEPAAREHAARALAEQRTVQLRGTLLISTNGHQISADVTLQPLDPTRLLLEVHPLVESEAARSPLSETLRGFAHEVRNPLASLRGAAQLLQRRLHDESLQGLAGMVIAEADRLTALANRLLNNDGVVRLERVNVHHVLQRLDDLLRAEPSPLRLQHDYDPSLPAISGDPDRLLQLLLNLARNAREAGAGTLLLRTRVEHGVRVGERMLRSALRVDVVDDGGGVPAPLRESLFQPLVSGRADGSGLGLALSREIAHEHGGELRHRRRPDETVFSLYLPLPAPADIPSIDRPHP